MSCREFNSEYELRVSLR